MLKPATTAASPATIVTSPHHRRHKTRTQARETIRVTVWNARLTSVARSCLRREANVGSSASAAASKSARAARSAALNLASGVISLPLRLEPINEHSLPIGNAIARAKDLFFYEAFRHKGTSSWPLAYPRCVATRKNTESNAETLAIDIGGTGLKGSVLDPQGQMVHDRVRCDTPYPLPPAKLVTVLLDLIKPLPSFDRVSVGFPGMVRNGKILSAPHFVSPRGPGGEPSPELVSAWNRFDLGAALATATAKPVKIANDADLQGAAVVKGEGLELVLTLGTGLGTALFFDGQLQPHLEFAHHPFKKGRSYNEVVGEAARERSGNKKWLSHVMEAVETLRALTFFDHCFIGGGNSARLGNDLPDDVTVVDNSAGILGGIKLWEVAAGPLHVTCEAATSSVGVAGRR